MNIIRSEYVRKLRETELYGVKLLWDGDRVYVGEGDVYRIIAERGRGHVYDVDRIVLKYDENLLVFDYRDVTSWDLLPYLFINLRRGEYFYYLVNDYGAVLYFESSGTVLEFDSVPYVFDMFSLKYLEKYRTELSIHIILFDDYGFLVFDFYDTCILYKFRIV